MRTELLSLWRGVIIIRRPDPRNMATITADVAALHHLTVEDLKGQQRVRSIAHPRQQAMAEMYATGCCSYPQIGMFLGGRDHTTVLHGKRAHERRMAA